MARVLAERADRLVGGTASVLVIDDTGVLKTWTDDQARCAAAGVPETVRESRTAHSDDVAQAFRTDVPHRSDFKSPSVPG